MRVLMSTQRLSANAISPDAGQALSLLLATAAPGATIKAATVVRIDSPNAALNMAQFSANTGHPVIGYFPGLEDALEGGALAEVWSVTVDLEFLVDDAPLDPPVAP